MECRSGMFLAIDDQGVVHGCNGTAQILNQLLATVANGRVTDSGTLIVTDSAVTDTGVTESGTVYELTIKY